MLNKYKFTHNLLSTSKGNTMKIFITDLEAYNNGHLVGNWYTLPMTNDELAEAIENELHNGRNLCKHTHHHEEYFISDYECSYMKIEEYSDIHKLNEIAQQIESWNDNDILKFEILLSEGYAQDKIIEDGLDSYEVDIYDFRSAKRLTSAYEQLAEQFVDEGLFGNIPIALQSYIDYEAISRDLRYDYSEYDTDIIYRVA
jgi:antirestriction protein